MAFGVVVIDDGAAHDKFAFALEAAADVFVRRRCSRRGRVLGGSRRRKRGDVPSHAVGSALDEEGKRRGDVGGLEDDGVEFDSVAHGDHGFSALVVVEEVMDGIAGAVEYRLRFDRVTSTLAP